MLDFDSTEANAISVPKTYSLLTSWNKAIFSLEKEFVIVEHE